MKIERAIVHAWASSIKAQAVNYVIQNLSQLSGDAMLSGEDSGLLNVWEEVCVQAQKEESFYWSAYADVIERALWNFLEPLERHEKLALWAETTEGWDWIWDHREDEEGDRHAPLDESEVITWLVSEVLSAAENYESDSIDMYLNYADEIDEDSSEDIDGGYSEAEDEFPAQAETSPTITCSKPNNDAFASESVIEARKRLKAKLAQIQNNE